MLIISETSIKIEMASYVYAQPWAKVLRRHWFNRTWLAGLWCCVMNEINKLNKKTHKKKC